MRLEDAYSGGHRPPEYVGLGHLDKPTCIYCDRVLTVGPGSSAGLAFKCPRHGRFHPAEYDANPTDVMKREVDENGASTLEVLEMLLIMLPVAAIFSLGRWIRSRLPW